jgi:hypothetical protein
MQNMDHNIGFREKRHFFVNCRKSQKIVITTSTPGGLVYKKIDCQERKNKHQNMFLEKLSRGDLFVQLLWFILLPDKLSLLFAQLVNASRKRMSVCLKRHQNGQLFTIPR